MRSTRKGRPLNVGDAGTRNGFAAEVVLNQRSGRCVGAAAICPASVHAETVFASQIFLENQMTELIPCVPWNDYAVFTYSDRWIIFAFDLAFIWISILLSHPETLGRRTGEKFTMSGEYAGSEAFDDEAPMCAYTE